MHRSRVLPTATLLLAALILTGGVATAQDVDLDGIQDGQDNCPLGFNPSQVNSDGDGVGDACDCCSADASMSTGVDADEDGVCETCVVQPDNCPMLDNETQGDSDADGLGDQCDDCPFVANASQADSDGDGVGNACDTLPGAPDRPAPFLTLPSKSRFLVGRPAGSAANGLYVQPGRACTVANLHFLSDCSTADGLAACLSAGGLCQAAVLVRADDLSPVSRFDTQARFLATAPGPGNATACGPFALFATDTDPGFTTLAELSPFPGSTPDDNNPTRISGFTGIWFPPSDGLYCLRAELTASTPLGPSQATEDILVQVDETPSIPIFVNVYPRQVLPAIFNLQLQAPDGNPVQYSLSLLLTSGKYDGFKQDDLGDLTQDKVSKNGAEGNMNCTPTAAKNALDRLCGQDPRLFPNPNDPERNLKLAKRLGVLMKTDTRHGTGKENGVNGLKAYLEERQVGCKAADGYTVTDKEVKLKAAGTSPPVIRPIDPGGTTWDFYETEMRKGEAVILHLHEYKIGADGKPSTADDRVGAGHTVTGQGGERGGKEDGKNKVTFVDPADGKTKEGTWEDKGGYSVVTALGKTLLVVGIVSVSPKQAKPAEKPAGNGSIPNTPENKYVVETIPFNTSTFDEGTYILVARTVDSEGNAAKNEITVIIDRSPGQNAGKIGVPALGAWGLAFLLALIGLGSLWLLNRASRPQDAV